MRRRRRNPITSFDRQFLDMLSEERRARRERNMFRTPVRELSDKDLSDLIEDAMYWIEDEIDWNDVNFDPREIEDPERVAEKVKAAADRGRDIVGEIESRSHLTIVEEKIGHDEGGEHYSYRVDGVRLPKGTELSEGAVRALELADGKRIRTNPIALAVNKRNRETRRRRNPYQGDVYTVPLISREQNETLLLFLTEGVVFSGEAEYARKKLLLPIIDDLAKIIDELENARVETGDPMTPFIDMKLQAEWCLAKVLYDVLINVDKRISVFPTTEQRSPERNPRRRRRLKRYY